MSSKLVWNQSAISKLKTDVEKRMFSFGYKIANQAKAGAPVLSGALRDTIHVTEAQAGLVIISAGGSFAGKKVDYARKREYENQAHPNTRYYMTNAFKWGEDNVLNFFKGVAG